MRDPAPGVYGRTDNQPGSESGKWTDVLILDFSKAFDHASHSLLHHKLQCYSVQGTTDVWISSFLCDRGQAVVVDGSQSSFVSVRSGVPQCTVLRPCLFLEYINDLPEKLTAQARLFADGASAYRMISSDWEKSWDMEFHPSKCQTLPITRSRNPLCHWCELHGHILDSVQSAKYLKITIYRELNWDQHVNNICNKANIRAQELCES